MTQMNLSTKQKQTQRHREQTCGCQRGAEAGEGWNIGNYVWYPVIIHNGKEYEYIYSYSESLWCTPETKLTWHCKSTILQF